MNSHQFDIERCVLASLLFHDRHYDDKPFIPNPDFFVLPFNKRAAARIKEAIEDDKSPSLALFIMEDSVINTRYEQDYFDLAATTAGTIRMAKQYHDWLKDEYIKRKVGML